ncbi:hypothetical protein ZOSMA_275G00120 [Zostera marina]|uniref:FAR1 domain-containing protein n=1 Tax=Zostera marina TaxID=29655 RepID=A0A0K9PDZ4_ZOSMR|nr:hypothetical protein ZOSMA_275G00120 [Zostera marina]
MSQNSLNVIDQSSPLPQHVIKPQNTIHFSPNSFSIYITPPPYRLVHAQPLNPPIERSRPPCNVSLDIYSIQPEKSFDCISQYCHEISLDVDCNAECSKNNDFSVSPNATYQTINGPNHFHETPLDIRQTPISSENNDVTVLPNTINCTDNASPSFFITKQPTDTNASSDDLNVNSPPFVGQLFSSYSEVVDKYYGYASKVVFSVRLSSTNSTTSKSDGKKILVMRRLLCSKQENVDLLHSVKKGKHRKNPVSRCGCCASIKLKRDDMSEKWIVKNIVLEHIIPSPHHQNYGTFQ